MVRRRLLASLCLGLTLTLLAPLQHASAETLVSTFGPGDSFGSARPPVSGAGTFLGYQARAMQFTIGADRLLTQVELALQHSVGTNSYLVSLTTDAGGQPGSILESWSFSAPTVASITGLSSVNAPLLSAGGTYWLTASAGANNTGGGWFTNDQGINTGGVFARSSATGSWVSSATNDLAFRVSGVAAPEPGPCGLLLLGGLMGLFFRAFPRLLGNG